MSLLAIEAEMLCTLAEEAADELQNILTHPHDDKVSKQPELAENLKKVASRIRAILREHPEDHNDESHTAQFHREVADEKGLLR